MKKMIIALLLIFTGYQVNAQISDAEAKLKFQKIEESYNQGNYGTAYNLSGSLMDEMKVSANPPPKIFYMFIKSAYKCFENGGLVKTYDYLMAFAGSAIHS